MVPHLTTALNGPLLELEQRIAELGLADTVRLLGHRDDVPDLIRGFDVAVCSSDFEGTPLSILEYMQARLPIVATQAERANAKLLSIARHAPDGSISNLAMRLMSAVHEARDNPQPDGRQIGVMLARLRDAISDLVSPAS